MKPLRYQTADGTLYEKGDHALHIIGTNIGEYERFLYKLCEDGHVHRVKRFLRGNRFDTMISEDGTYTVFSALYPSSGTARIIREPCGFVPSAKPMDFERKVVPSITQIGRNGALQSAAGMSLAVQLADGRYVMFDGGPNDDGDVGRLYAFLKEHAPDGKPVIAAWFISHAHKDHVGLAGAFLERFGDRVEVQLAAFNFPDFCTDTIVNEQIGDMACYAAPFLEQCRKRKIPLWKLHTGQCMAFVDAYVDVLYTQEDLFPLPFTWGNHTSACLRLTVGDNVVLVLGDCEQVICEQMAKHYAEELKCDVLQASHHGLNGASLSLYQAADPDICFWPIDEERFRSHPICLGESELYTFNAWLRDETVKRRHHYHASETRTVLLT